MQLYLLLTLLGVAQGTNVTNALLCGQWIQSAYGSNGKSCVQTPRCGRSSPPRVTEQFSFNTNDHSYIYSNNQFASSSCQSNEDFYVAVGGNYSLGQETVTNWTGITYTPTWFWVRASSGSSYPPNSTDESQCIDLIQYLNLECPCNGTWVVGQDRTIIKAQCPPGTCNDTDTVFDSRPQYGNVQIQQNSTTKLLVLTIWHPDQTAGFNETIIDFAQTPGCGRGCKSCSVPSGNPNGYNCTECCVPHANPIPSDTQSNCECAAKFHNVAPDNFTLNCTSAASRSFSFSVSVFTIVSIFSFLFVSH